MRNKISLLITAVLLNGCAGNVLTVKNNQDLSFLQMLEAAQIKGFDDNINTHNFPIAITYKQKLKIIFVGLAESGPVPQKPGFRPARLEELLAVAADQELNPDYIYLALGSVWKNAEGKSFIPYLTTSEVYSRDHKLLRRERLLLLAEVPSTPNYRWNGKILQSMFVQK